MDVLNKVELVVLTVYMLASFLGNVLPKDNRAGKFLRAFALDLERFKPKKDEAKDEKKPN